MGGGRKEENEIKKKLKNEGQSKERVGKCVIGMRRERERETRKRWSFFQRHKLFLLENPSVAGLDLLLRYGDFPGLA